jgi:hypothetical protein
MTQPRSNTRPRQIFLSYANADRDVATRLSSALQDAGLRVWFGESELNIGDSVFEKIDKAIASSDVLLVFLSPTSVKSRYVQAELNSILSRELRDRAVTIVPALIKDCEIPPSLEKYRFLDLRHDLAAGVAKLVQQLYAVSDVNFSRLTSS